MYFNLLKENALTYVEQLTYLVTKFGGNIEVIDYEFFVSIEIESNGLSAYINYDWISTHRHFLRVYAKTARKHCVEIPLEDLEVIYDL